MDSPASTILITGANGQIGSFVTRHAEEHGLKPIALSRSELDITDASAVARIISKVMPGAVINCAAYTHVDKAESEPGHAGSINAEGVETLARSCAPDIPLFHISTDYVFDGTKTTPYTEDDPTNPLNVYGLTKLAGEQKCLSLHNRAIVLRTAWVYSEIQGNFLKTMLRLVAERNELSVVNDQYGSPTHAEDVARAVLTMACKVITEPASSDFGIFHFSGAGTTTWYAFAAAIFDELKQVTGKEVTLNGIPTEDYPTPARRTRYSVLDCSKINRAFNIPTVDWEPRVRATVRKVLEQEGRLS